MEENTQQSTNMMPMIISVILIVIVAALAFYFTQVRKPVTTTNTTDQTSLTELEGGEPTGMDTETSTDSGLVVDEDQKTFEVSASDFEFSLAEITVKKGDTVKIVFTNTKGMHDFQLDEFDVSTEVLNPDETEEVTFVADTAGEFEYYCSVGQHRANGMVGTLTVEE